VIVVDASALLGALSRAGRRDDGRSAVVRTRTEFARAPFARRRGSASGPSLCGKRAIELERGRTVLVDLADFPIRRYPHAFLLSRVWQLRNNLMAMMPSMSRWRRRSTGRC
jgi:predicted nucleic acid-binding protein